MSLSSSSSTYLSKLLSPSPYISTPSLPSTHISTPSSPSTHVSTPSSPSTHISTPSSPSTSYISTPSSPSSSSETPPSNSEKSETRNWLDLPRDVTSMILLKVGTIEILNNAQRVCTQWRSICNDPIMWRTIHVHNLGYPYYNEDIDEMMMWRHAIDRSRGNLVDITFQHFGSDDLLNYVTDSSSHLQRMRLINCGEISDEWLSEVAKKLPFLEELDITRCYLSKDSLEAIGLCCPLLKSLKFNIQSYYDSSEVDDGEAFVIAQTMPGLRHLQLFGNKLSNDGLLAILDGCPLLQSLDLRRCLNVDLGGSLGRICAEQIKVLLEPDDPTDDYPYYDEDRGSYSSCYTCRLWNDDHNYDNSEQSDHEQNERQQHESDHEQNAWLLDLDLGCYPYI